MYNHSYTLTTIGGLISITYIYAVVWAVACLLLCWLIAGIIKFEGGRNPRDAFKRRVWFYIILAFCAISFFLWNLLYVMGLVKGIPAQDKFMAAIAITTVVSVVAYFIAGLMVSKLFPKTKMGTIFPSKNN